MHEIVEDIVEERDSALANEEAAADDELGERSSTSLSELSAVASPVESGAIPLLDHSFSAAATSIHYQQQRPAAVEAVPQSIPMMVHSPSLHSLPPDWSSAPSYIQQPPSSASVPPSFLRVESLDSARSGGADGGGGGGSGGHGASASILRTNSHIDTHFASHLQSPPRINFLYSHSPELMGNAAGAGVFDEISPSDLLQDSSSSQRVTSSAAAASAGGDSLGASAAAAASSGAVFDDDRSSSPDLPVHKRSRASHGSGSEAPSSAPLHSRRILGGGGETLLQADRHRLTNVQGSRSTSDGHWPSMEIEHDDQEE